MRGRVAWRFQADDGKKTLYLFDVGSVKIERHVKVKGAASPDDPSLEDYWQTRRVTRKARTRKRKVTRPMPPRAEADARAV